MGLFRFKGFPGKGTFSHGIHPPDNKFFSADKAIEVLPTPAKVVLPLLQNIGAPCEPVVKSKQQVTVGELVGKGKAFVSAALHSPVAGTVKKPVMVTLPNGRHMKAIQIVADEDQNPGQMLWNKLSAKDWPTDCISIYEPATISKVIHDAGIVGLGGAAFPTHVKVMP